MIGLMVPSAFALEDKGDFYLIFNSPMYDSDIIEMAVNELNRSYVLQQDIPIKFQKCGYENAYWDNSIKTVVMCEELVSMFQEQFGKSFKGDLDRQQTSTLFATLFVMYHEVGHGLVDEYSLPVLAREENYVDRFATYEMIEKFGAASLAPAILWYIGTSSYGTVELFGTDIIWNESAYAGKHNLNEQRGYDLACLGFGALLTSGENAPILKEYAVLLEGKRTELSCKSEYGQSAYSFQVTFNEFDPEIVAKKNAYEKAKRDAILKAQSEEEQLRLNAYNTLSFLYETRMPWVEERVIQLGKVVTAIDTVGAPSGITSQIVEGELFVPDEPTRLKINMGDRIIEWNNDVRESYTIASNAFQNKEYRTALQYAEKSMEYSESGPELVEWLNQEIVKVNKIKDEIRQENESKLQDQSSLNKNEQDLREYTRDELGLVGKLVQSVKNLSYPDVNEFKNYSDIDTKKMRNLSNEIWANKIEVREIFESASKYFSAGKYELALENLEKTEELAKNTLSQSEELQEEYLKISAKVESELIEVAQFEQETRQEESSEIESSEGGGCLIATAAFGSEMAPQVQFLRELRDNTVMTTQSGTTFMTGFNQFYYSFSPACC